MSEKAYFRVLDAIRAGARTSRDVEAFTGIPAKAASAWLTVLCRDGMVRRTGSDCISYGDRGRGRIFNSYVPAEARRAA